MSAKIKIPRGWRALPYGTVLKKGDKGFGSFAQEWFFTCQVGRKIGSEFADCQVYIRRKPKTRKAK